LTSNYRDDDTILASYSLESVFERGFVPCVDDLYNTSIFSKSPKYFKAVEMVVASGRAMGLKPEGGSGGTV